MKKRIKYKKKSLRKRKDYPLSNKIQIKKVHIQKYDS